MIEISTDVLEILKGFGVPNPSFERYSVYKPNRHDVPTPANLLLPADAPAKTVIPRLDEDSPRIIDTSTPTAPNHFRRLRDAQGRPIPRAPFEVLRASTVEEVAEAQRAETAEHKRRVVDEYAAAMKGHVPNERIGDRYGLPTKLDEWEEVGVTSEFADAPALHQLFFADCDNVSFKQCSHLDPVFHNFVLVKTSEVHQVGSITRRLHLYGPVMHIHQINALWDDMIRLNFIDRYWVPHQQIAQHAVLRVSANFKKFLPRRLCTIGELLKFPGLVEL